AGTADRLGAPVTLHLVGSAATGAAAANAAVVDLSSRADPDHPAQRQLYARLVNFGPDAVTAPVSLAGDGIEVSRQTVTLPPNGGSSELTWALPQGATRVSVRIETTDALPADNEASLVVQGAGSLGLDVLLVSDAPAALQKALSALPGAQVTSVPTDGFASAIAGHAYDLFVFDRTAPPDAAAPTGAPMLFVDPPAGGPFATNGVMTDPTVDRLRAQDPLLQGVDLSGATFGAAPIYQLDRGQDEVVGASQGPLVFRDHVAGQPTIVLAFDLTQSNLPQRVAFPILIANAVGELAPNPLPPSVPLGDPLAYRPRAGATTVRITPPGAKPVDLAVAASAAADSTGVDAGAAADVGGLRDVVFSDTGSPGTYAVQELDAAGQPRGGGAFTVNAGHPRESDLRPNPDLAATLARAKAAGDAGARASLAEWWPLLALLGLGLLAIEWIVALSRRRPGAPRRLPGRSAA
ncbi:MAG TPA: hypothetical protein VFU81_09645, partial [Thermomicrobiales bacterium]|nr:hypothetical protein [Thermomicrobiales bacterium]